jgi:hypothetical protein
MANRRSLDRRFVVGVARAAAGLKSAIWSPYWPIPALLALDAAGLPRYNAASDLPRRPYVFTRIQGSSPGCFKTNHRVSTTVLKKIEVEECKFL